MSESTLRAPVRLRVSVRLAVAATAFSVLAYEIALTRIFSVLFRSPFVFLILSVAVCGLGLGAALAAVLDSRAAPDPDDEARYLGRPLLALAVLLPVPLLVLLTVAKDLIADARGPAVAVLTAAPYLAAGLFLSRAFRAHANDSGKLYFFDLGGAGLAALVTAAVLSRVGGVAVPMLLGLLTALAALGLTRGRSWWRIAAVTVALANFWLLGNQLQPGALGLPALRSEDQSKVKPLFQELGDPKVGAKVLYTEWSPVARTDVVSNAGTDTLFIWTDGDVPTQMEPFGGTREEMLKYGGFIGFVPYGLRPGAERVLCIGPGGGLDCLLALLGGAKKIEPVEINPAIARVTAKYSSFYGNLYRRPEIDPGLIIDEGRSYMSRSNRRYDVIYFALAKSATTQQGGMALVDNYLYTVEAFSQYWSHLSDKGQLALVFQNPALTDRCLATAVAALMQTGLKGPDIADRLAYLGIRGELSSTPYQYLMLLSKKPFTAEERKTFKRIESGFHLRYVPGVAENQPYAALRECTSAAQYARRLADQDDYLVRLRLGGPLVRLNLSPVTDNRPFYADMAPGLNPMLLPILWFSLGAGALALLLALAVTAWSVDGDLGARLRYAAPPVLYFAGLGAAFLLVEVALIQKLVLVLGYPTLTLTVILFTLLLGAAVGGLLANRGTADEAMGRLRLLIPVLMAVQLAAGWLAPLLGQHVLSAPLAARVALVAACVLPMGLLMGQPFPTGLRLLGERRVEWVPMAWAVNGVLSVTGSVLAAAVASLAGYQAVLVVGAILYGVTGAVGLYWRGISREGD
ncbi:MAG: hypothetical protein HZB16_12500 [Armatimonadetes bacterium]|nr:hypothetical protein [Armatimonadota bacterium]